MAIYKIWAIDDIEGARVDWAASEREALQLAEEMGVDKPQEHIIRIRAPRNQKELVEFLRMYTPELDNG